MYLNCTSETTKYAWDVGPRYWWHHKIMTLVHFNIILLKLPMVALHNMPDSIYVVTNFRSYSGCYKWWCQLHFLLK